MSIKMTIEEKHEIQARYRHLTNYQEEDPEAPIDPLTYVDSGGDHLLHIAAMRGDLNTVEVLLRVGDDINRRGEMGMTALHYARMQGNNEIAEFLLLHGADGTLRDDFGRLAADIVR